MGAVIVSDNFEESAHPGNAVGTANSPAIPFLVPVDGLVFNGTVTNPNDATFGRVLKLDDGDISASTTTAAVGVLPGSVLLSNAGDTVTVSFKFRFTVTSSANTFRFGLFNSVGTSAAGTGSHNDIGYYVSLPEAGSGGVTNSTFYRENSGTNPAMGGGDRTNYVSSAVIPALTALGASELYSLSLTLTRTSTNINFSLGIAAGAGPATTYTATTNASLITSFDEIMFNSGFNNATSGGTDLIIDDLMIDASNFVVPEPSTALLTAFAGVGLLFRRRK